MGKSVSFLSGRAINDRRWWFIFFTSLLLSVTLCAATLLLISPLRSLLPFDIISSFTINDSDVYFMKPELKESDRPLQLLPEAPRIAYLISGTKGDNQRMTRILQAVYHPRNQYVPHLDLDAPPWERLDLAAYVEGEIVFSETGNVRLISKANWVTQDGPTSLAVTLHAVATLLKEGLKWDWFGNLGAQDYPLMTQDDILHVFSSLPRPKRSQFH